MQGYPPVRPFLRTIVFQVLWLLVGSMLLGRRVTSPCPLHSTLLALLSAGLPGFCHKWVPFSPCIGPLTSFLYPGVFHLPSERIPGDCAIPQKGVTKWVFNWGPDPFQCHLKAPPPPPDRRKQAHDSARVCSQPRKGKDKNSNAFFSLATYLCPP